MSSRYDTALYGTATYDGVSVGNPLVELFLNGAWVNVTSYVRVAEGIQIRRGRQDWSSAPTFATCDLTLDNRDGRFSPRNPSGAYYPYLVRNTPLRVSVYNDSGTAKVRFWGDVAEFPVDVVGMGADVVTRVQGAGLRRRLSHSPVLQSAYRLAAGALGSLVAYWPLEVDGSGATQYASTTGGKAMLASNTVNGGTSSDFSVTSADLPALVGDQASLQGYVPDYALSVSGQEVRMLMECDTSTAGQGVDIIVAFTSGDYIVAEYVPVANTVQITYRSADGTSVANTGPSSAGSFPWSTPTRLSIESVQNGTGVDFGVAWYPTPSGTGSGGVYSATAAATTLTPVKSVTVRNGGSDVTTVVGHITVQNTKTALFDLLAVTAGYAGETARNRAVRLAAAQGVALSAVAEEVGITSELMGVQGTDTFLNLFDETAFVDDGISTETVDARSLTWWPRSTIYSVPAVYGLIAGSTSLNDLAPTDDDQLVVNDVTANRVNGGSANYMVTSGNLSIGTIGDYQASYDLNVYTDDQLPYQAQWRATVGTVDEARWMFTLDALRISNALGKRDLLIALREGDRFLVTVVPTILGTATTTVSTILLGWTETITDTAWTFVFNTRPGSPYTEVLILDDTTFGILDTDRLAL